MKKVHGRIYAHRISTPLEVTLQLTDIGDYDVVSWEGGFTNIRATKVDDWFNKYEPVITHLWSPERGWVNEGKNPRIYHHTHLFMHSDYKATNKKWTSARANRMLAIELLMPNKLKMGRLDWWLNWINENHLPTI